MEKKVHFQEFEDSGTEKKQKKDKPDLQEQWQKEESTSNEKETIEEKNTQEVDSSQTIEEKDLVTELQEKLEKIQNERDEYVNHLKRLQAEFDNFRKRTQRERAEMQQHLLQEIISRLLDVLDNLERSLHPDNETEDVQSYKTGIEMVFQQFVNLLKDYGLTKVVTEGEKFDPNFHEAVSQIQTNEYEPGTIVNEISPGYLLKDRVLRAPKVQVAAAPPEEKMEEE